MLRLCGNKIRTFQQYFCLHRLVGGCTYHAGDILGLLTSLSSGRCHGNDHVIAAALAGSPWRGLGSGDLDDDLITLFVLILQKIVLHTRQIMVSNHSVISFTRALIDKILAENGLILDRNVFCVHCYMGNLSNCGT